VDLKYIRYFGCIVYYKVFDHDKGKFEAYSNKKVLLGFNFRAFIIYLWIIKIS